jgi:ribonucleotide monophosphatase NagD (HAD superfamily)
VASHTHTHHHPYPPGPGMFVEMLKKSMPPASGGRTFCCGKGGNVGRKFMIDRAIQMLKAQGHSGEREHIMIVGDRFDTDVRAGVLAGIKSCLLESGAHTLEI